MSDVSSWLQRPEVLVLGGAAAGKVVDFLFKRYGKWSDREARRGEAEIRADEKFRNDTMAELDRQRQEIRELKAGEDSWRRRYYRLLHFIAASRTFDELKEKVQIETEALEDA